MMSNSGDHEIRETLLDLIELDEALIPAEVQVMVSDGVVMLAGDVPSTETSAAIETTATSLRGVIAVINHLAVAPDTDHAALGGL